MAAPTVYNPARARQIQGVRRPRPATTVGGAQPPQSPISLGGPRVTAQSTTLPPATQPRPAQPTVGGGGGPTNTGYRPPAGNTGYDQYGRPTNPQAVAPTRTGPGQEAMQGIQYQRGIGAIPSVGNYTDQLPNSAAGYEGMDQWARNTIGGAQPYQGPQNDQYSQAWQQTFNQANASAPNMPNAPGMGQYNTNYQAPTAPGFQAPQFSTQGGPQLPARPDLMAPGTFAASGYRGSEFDTSNLGGGAFNPNAVGGPNLNPVGGVDRGAFGGPATGAPGYNELLQQSGVMNSGTGVSGNVSRETLQGSNFQNNPLFGGAAGTSGQAYQAALAASQNLATGGGIDTAALQRSLAEARDRNLAAAAEVGRGNTLARGANPAGGSVGGLEVGRQLAPVAAEAAAREQEALMQAEIARQQMRGTGAGQLGQLGQGAGQTAQGYGQMLQGEAQNLNQGSLEQRAQDITQRGQTIGGEGSAAQLRAQTVGQLAGTAQEGALGAFGAGTTRGTQMNQLMQQADQLRQSGDVAGYNALTQRIATEGGISTDEANTQVARYQAASQRANDQGNLRAEAQKLGYNYDSLNADQQNQFRNQLLQRYQTEGQQSIGGYEAGTGQFQAETQRGLGVGGLQQQANETGLGYAQLDLATKQQNDTNIARGNSELLNLFQQSSANATDAYGAQTSRLSTLLGAAQGMYGISEQARQAAGEQTVQMANLAAEVLSNGANAQQAMNELKQAGITTDLNALYQFWQTAAQNGYANQQLRRSQNPTNAIIGGVLEGAGNAIGG